MHFAFDPKKDRQNRRDHGISLAPDLREDYGEERWIVLGLIDTRLFQAAVTVDPFRVFSLRPASPRERQEYHDAFHHKTPRP